MLVSTTIPLVRQSIPQRARVEAVFATAPDPFTNQPVRVLVEGIRQVRDVTPVYWLVTDVRIPNAASGFSVRLESLRYLSAFISMVV